jgi:hypothetical protein
MDITKELNSNQTVLLLMPSASYNKQLVGVVKKLAKKSVCYVTLNKTANSLKEMFKKGKVNVENIVFIDAISATVMKVPKQDNACYYCSSPGSLTEISLMVSKFLRHKFDYLIFDSLTNLLIYQKKAPVGKFVSSLINKIKASDTRAVFYALSAKEQQDLIQQSGMFVDKVVSVK